jgi:nucleoside-diphosphate-sugar epimerase
MKFLVTGAHGFIGTHLGNELRAQGYDVFEVDHNFGNLREHDTIARALDEAGDVDYVVHLAAKVGRLFGEDDVSETVADNAGMTARIAQECGQRGIRLAYASTSEVYGDLGEKTAYEGGLMLLPHNIYGLSKRWGEEAAQLYAPDGLIAFRISMPYGPGLPAGRGRAAMINILHQALTRQPIPIHKGAERSWCWVGDTARGMRMVLEYEMSRPENKSYSWNGPTRFDGSWNVGRDDIAIPMRTVAELACAMTDAPLSLIEDVEPPGRQTVVKRLSSKKLRDIGWEPQVELGEGMERTLEWIKAGFPPIRTEER